MNYKLSEIAAVVGGKFTGCDAEVRSVVTDSRSLSCELGCCPMFVAMRGANHDSHGFVAQMSARGVRAFLVERDVECPADCGFVRVDNAIDALQRLAAHYRAQFRGTVVGITGSNGKTVIKEWIAEELPAGMKYYRSPKSYNSQLGVPLSVLMLEGDEELAIFEAGISKPGEMERLERIIRPDVVVFTSIGDAHQENFLNLEQKCDEKMVLAHRAETIVYHSYYEPLGRMIASRFAGRKLCDAASCPEVPETLIGNEASRRNARIVEAFCAAMGYPAPSFTAGPGRRDVLPCIRDKRTRYRFFHRQLREAEHDAKHDDPAQEIGEDRGRARFFENIPGAEEVTTADDPAQRDQLQMAIL